ncbi:MAG: hypothetical protein A2270_07205 [Elusimicrobia bacterium RIFOXYA12_FULL_51_18]|nr:MAG: hypothetical protein A2270_07205 [Elusimicrobia bacterium RIFOXYA12_FULL_51_18]OGS28471.1 MAG: hypothetical protein A2218_05510 [Elusimicrobia bacterium RIFOXYA2_FULL_53_38]
MNEESFLIDCPMCKARIEVEKKTGKVLRHWEKPMVKEGSDQMKDALEKIKDNKSRLDDYFSKARGEMERKKKELLENFEKEKKRIKDSGDTSRPINPMDLD